MIQNINFEEEIKKLTGLKRRRGEKNISNKKYRSFNVKMNNIKVETLTVSKKTSLMYDIKECLVYHATEEDFKNPIQYIDNLWRKNSSTGIIKIIPPTTWLEYNNKVFNQYYLPKFENSENKLETRIQTLNKLFYGKVNYY
jgi:hypothetical protein